MPLVQQTRKVLGGTLACAVLACVAAFAQSLQSGSPVRGKQLYYDHGCYGCHGFNGQTGARDLVGTASPVLEDPEAFIAYLRLRADYQPNLPSTRMPHYAPGALSDADAMHIYAYVRTFKPDAPDPGSIPAFKDIVDSAKAVYQLP